MHQGKWTEAEEKYVEALIEAFKAGVVPIPEGTTLRVFLCSMLNCPAKRISKKMVGTKYNGRQLYVRKRDGEVSERTVKKHQTKLREMEQKYIESLAPIIDFHEMTMQKERAAAIPAEAEASVVASVARKPQSPLLQSQSPPLMSTKASASLPLQSPTNLAHALQADSISRLLQLRAIRERLGNGAIPTLPGHDLLLQTNTAPAACANNDLIMSLIRQKQPPALSAFTKVGSPPAPTPLFPQGSTTDFLIERLKRKLVHPQDSNFSFAGPISKKPKL